MIAALALSGLTFFSTMAGGLAALRWPARSEWLMALAGGVVLGAALFDLLPEAVEHADEQGWKASVPLGAVLVGYLFFTAAERYAHRHDEGRDAGHGHVHGRHDHTHAAPDPAGTEPAAQRPAVAGLVGAAGFVVHSFFDGLAIGLGFQIDSAVGLLVALAVIGHDFSDGLNTVSLLRAARYSTDDSRRWLRAVATAPIAGAAAGSFLPVPESVFPLILGFFSGLFLYAASVHLLPAVRRLPALGGLATVAAGSGLMLLIATLAHH